MKFLRNISLICYIVFVASRCQTNLANEEHKQSNYKVKPTVVDIQALKIDSFNIHIFTNGKLSGLKQAKLYFKQGGVLESLNVKSGQHVELNCVLASLDQSNAKIALKQAKLKVEQSQLNIQDFLLGQGFNINDSTNIPKEIFAIGDLQNGYTQALLDLELAENNLAETLLKAPFAGTVTNIEIHKFEQINTGEVFCNLIDNSIMKATFSLLESELVFAKIGQAIKITPIAFPDTVFEGTITEINPLVDENGLIQIKGEIKNNGQLLSGMNVKVVIETPIPNQLIVPRSAVVLRQNQEVLFKVVNNKAYWTYVHIVAENSTSYAVVPNTAKGASLEPGDSIIISNNINLAHDTEINIKNK